MFYGFTNEYSVILKEDVEKPIARVSEKDSLNHDASLYQKVMNIFAIGIKNIYEVTELKY